METVLTPYNITDAVLTHVERIVADAYNVTTTDLHLFYKDSDAKLMCCFLLFDRFDFKQSYLAKHYKINPEYLMQNIVLIYVAYFSNGRVTKIINHIEKQLDTYLN